MTETPLSSAELKQKAATLQAARAIAPWIDDLTLSEASFPDEALPTRVVTLVLDLPHAEDILDPPVRDQLRRVKRLIGSELSDPEHFADVMLSYRMKDPKAEWLRPKGKRDVARP